MDELDGFLLDKTRTEDEERANLRAKAQELIERHRGRGFFAKLTAALGSFRGGHAQPEVVGEAEEILRENITHAEQHVAECVARLAGQEREARAERIDRAAYALSMLLQDAEPLVLELHAQRTLAYRAKDGLRSNVVPPEGNTAAFAFTIGEALEHRAGPWHQKSRDAFYARGLTTAAAIEEVARGRETGRLSRHATWSWTRLPLFGLERESWPM
jgi:hypothetical protein